ncbi:MAG: polysaccharide lyase 8 family protein [Chitinophagaceae bacterium]
MPVNYLKKRLLIGLMLPMQLFAQDDFSIIRKNIVDGLQFDFTDAAVIKKVVIYQPQQLPDGSWKDIDYKDNSITIWKPAEHLERLKIFAIATSKPNGFYYQNSSLQSGILAGLRYWNKQDAQSKNWWHNEIATPQTLGEILLTLQESGSSFPKGLMDTLVNSMKKGNPYDKTGANKLDIALHYLYRACITKDASLMDSATSEAFQPISFTTKEGLQYDYSYLQHSTQLQISSYGLVFLSGEYKVASWLQGTAYALSGEKLKLLDTYFTQTFLPTIRGRYIDFNTEGRGISRTDILDKLSLAGKSNQLSLLALAKKVNPVHAALIDTALLRITQKEAPGYGISPSHIHFWKGDYTLHLRKNYSFNVRTASTRTKRTETGNKENLLGKFLPDGSTNIQRSGSEYYNIMPVWEWDKIPGTTSRDFVKDQSIDVQWGEPGSTSFVGGVSDSVYGVTTYDMNYNDVQAKKSYFFFDNEVVCLGAGISSGSAENIITTLNQCWLQGKAIVGFDNKTEYVKKSKAFTNPSWAWHDRIGYFFPAETNMTVSTQSQSGNWALINASRSKDKISGDVFKLWINHGAKPSNASYAYIVVPGIDLKQATTYKSAAIIILANTSSIQAVQHDGLNILQVVFHEAGTISANDISITADKPCVILLNKANNTISVADPTQKIEEVSISLNAHNKNVKLNCTLPKGNYAGSSVHYKIAYQ